MGIGGVSNFTISYSPDTFGGHTAALVISNDSPSGVYTMNLAGATYQFTTNVGPYGGGNTITITNGADFGAITNVRVGGTSVRPVSSGANWFTIALPAASAAGPVDFVIQTSDNGDITLSNAYTYNPAGIIMGGGSYSNVWTSVGSGMTGSTARVRCLAYEGVNLYAGGDFTGSGGVPAANIAQWNGTAWTNLGSGMILPPMVLKTVGTDLYVAGDFTNAGGVAGTKYIAKWNGAAWESLGGGMNNSMNALAHDGTNLYAGGSFTNAGGVSAARVARWNGTAWTNIGSGMSGASAMVWTMAHDGTNLYAGGTFTNAGGVSVTNVARWNGASWTNLGGGVNGLVLAMTWGGSKLYVAGSFTAAGGVSATNIAMWNGTAWTNLGGGLNLAVYALAHDGTNLYAGGTFTNAGGVAANRVAMWNGTAWTNLGSGWSAAVRALAHDGTNLYAGGNTATVGGIPLVNVAKWGPVSASGPAIVPSSGSWTGGYEVSISGSNLGNGGDITNVTLCGTSATIVSQTAERVWITAGVALSVGPGDVRVYSVSFGETVKSNAFTYEGRGMTVLGTNGAAIVNGASAQSANGTKFPQLLSGTSWTNTFAITNNGTETVTISGFGNINPSFEITGLPAAVAAGGVSNFTVKFAPTSVGTYNDWLTISNDSPTPAYVVRLYGPCYVATTNVGPYGGGNSNRIANGYFGIITNVLVNGVAANLVETNASSFTIVMPPATNAGAVSIVIQTSDNGDILLRDAYTYNAPGLIGASTPWDWSAWETTVPMPDKYGYMGAAVYSNKLYSVGGQRDAVTTWRMRDLD